jgi:hypothetical protein
MSLRVFSAQILDYSNNATTHTITTAGMNILATAGDKLTFIENGVHVLIGIVKTTITVPTTVITLEDRPNTNSLGDIPNLPILYVATPKVSEIQGHGGTPESFAQFNHPINLLKGLVHTDAYSHADVTASLGEDFWDINSTIGRAPNSYAASHLVWPLAFWPPDKTSTSSSTGHTSQLLKALHALDNNEATTLVFTSASLFASDGIHGVFLDRFSVEGGDRDLNVEAGTTFPPIKQSHRRTYPNFHTINSELRQNFASFETPTGTVRNATSNDADGVFMGFKLRILIPASTTYVIDDGTKIVGAGGSITYKISIESSDAPYLDYVKDLTGTYLVSEQGIDIYTGNTYSNATTANSVSDGINDTNTHGIAYVLSHEIDTSNATKTHIFIVDREIVADRYVRVMQPNETTFYDFSPTEISMSTLSSSYTKMAYKKEMYDNPKDYLLSKGKGGRKINTTRNHGSGEAILSMYVGIDLDALSASGNTHIVARTNEINMYWGSDATKPTTESKTVLLTDGNTKNKTTLSIVETAGGTYFSFGEMQEMVGVVSMSEIMTIITDTKITGNPKRALIGSVVSICDEADNLVNDLFEENNIDFTTNYENNFPLFISPNFTGIDLFTAVNYIIEQKDKKLNFENNKFNLIDKDNTNNFANILITDRNDYWQIKDFTKSDVLFDFYNEIIVYGSYHQASKHDLRSIRSRGKKTLEHDDVNLLTLDDCVNKAHELLKLHSTLNQKITLEIGHKGLSQLRAGDIISIEMLQENLVLNQYQILEMKHTIGGFIRMELGRYSKGLDDRFAEILADGKRKSAQLRNTITTSTSINSFIDIPTIKEVKLLAVKRTTTGGNAFNIGFATTIGFATPMGFSTIGSATAIETILEVDL